MNSIFVKLAVTSEDGPWQNDTLSYNYDSLRCETGVGLNSTTISTYGYDDLSRLSGLNSIAGNFAYDYVNNSGLLNEIDFPNGAKNTFTYDGLERLTQVQSVTSGSVNIGRFAYTLGNRDIRTSLEKTFGTDPTRHIDYGYDTVNQLTSAVSTETPPDINQTWAYDPMGNRTQHVSTPGSNPTSTATYTSNRLNQIIGISTTTGSNTVESTFTYDADGNTTQIASDNSTTQYSYDDMDRLSAVVYKNSTGINVSKNTYAYDGFSRLRVITKYTWDTGTSAWLQQSQKKLLYDGMQVIQERDGSDNVIANDIWDGNIGGLEVRVVYDINTPTNPPQKYFYHYDGSGNVSAVTDNNQATVAAYDYDAYGNLTSSNGTYVLQNPWRFSTKYYDSGSGLYYYGFRFYSPGLGKWINRDPIAEDGGLNLYGFVGNGPTNGIDEYGLSPGDWWDLRSYATVPSELNPFNKKGSLRNSLDSAYEGGAALLHGDTVRGARAYKYGIFGQTQNSGYEYYATRGSIAIAGTAATAAGGLMACEVAGVSEVGSDVTFHLWRYPNAGGGGFNVANQGARKFGIDIHRFKYSNGPLKGQWARWYHRIHGHWEGAAKNAIKWHREFWTGRKL